jgi:acyl-coenzyme A synthetase/AMP-(fatty) acid ligase
MENVISGHEAVALCAVAGLACGKNTAGTIPTAFVVLKEDRSPETQSEVLREIDKLCLERLPTYYRPLAYRSVRELPYTLMGKIDFRELEKETFDPANFLVTDFEFFPELR